MAKKTLVKPLVKSSREPRKTRSGSNMTCDTGSAVETLWTHGRWGRAIKQWRKKVGWSANDLAKALGVSRSYIKHIESDRNGWEVRPRIEKQLRALMENMPSALPQSKIRTLVSRFHIPQRLYVAVAPRRCRGHGRSILFGSKNQMYCNRECRRLYYRHRRKEERKERAEREEAKPERNKKKSTLRETK